MLSRLTRALCVSAALAALLGCQPQPDATPAAGGATSPGAPKAAAPAPAGNLTITVCPKGLTAQFWTTVHAGAEAAGTELGAKIDWRGPDSETDINTQKALIEDSITKKVNAIVMAACDAKALVGTVKKAEEAGIPVITIDSGLEGYDARSLVATDNVAAAKLAGETLIKLIGGKGDVGVVPFIKGAASSDAREQGFKDAVTANKDVKCVATLFSEGSEAKGKDVVADMLNSHPDIKGIFACNEPGVVGAATALQAAKKVGQVKLVGFDGSPQEVQLLESGVVSALVLQDPFKMGHEGVVQAINAINKKPVEKRVDTGVLVVTKDNLKSPEAQRLINPGAAAPAPASAKDAKPAAKPEPPKTK